MSALAETDAEPRRVLVLGRSRSVLDAVTRELAECGLTVDASARPERAALDFDPSAFDLVAIGGGVDSATRTGIKRAFTARNPGVRLVDAYAPDAVQQILDAFRAPEAPSAIDLDGYLARIGFDGAGTADLETLRALHELHPATIPFEAIDVLLGRDIDLTPAAVDAKLIDQRRGGYCFEQNNLFRRALEALGFRVQGLIARVTWGQPAGSPPTSRSHMALQVEVDGVSWLADVGFGSVVPTEPLRLDTEKPQETRHETFRVIRFGRDRLLQVRRDGIWLPMYRLSPERAYESDYAAANWYTATHPASPFRRSLIAARTTPETRCTLLDRQLTIRRPGRETERRELDADGIEQALIGLFELPVEAGWRQVIERAAAGRQAPGTSSAATESN